MTQTDESAPDLRKAWLLLAFAVVFSCVSFVSLYLVSSKSALVHMQRLAELNAALPMPTVLAILTANWCLRLLPFVVVGAPFIGVIAAVVLAVAFKVFPPIRALRAITLLILAFGVGGTLTSGLIIFRDAAIRQARGDRAQPARPHPPHHALGSRGGLSVATHSRVREFRAPA